MDLVEDKNLRTGLYPVQLDSLFSDENWTFRLTDAVVGAKSETGREREQTIDVMRAIAKRAASPNWIAQENERLKNGEIDPIEMPEDGLIYRTTEIRSFEDLYATRELNAVGLVGLQRCMARHLFNGLLTADPWLGDDSELRPHFEKAWSEMTMGSTTPDMVALLQHAMLDCPIMPMEVSDLPFINGFIHLEQPLFIPMEITDSTAPGLRAIRGMAWTTVSGPDHPYAVANVIDEEDEDRSTATCVVLALYADATEPVIPAFDRTLLPYLKDEKDWWHNSPMIAKDDDSNDDAVDAAFTEATDIWWAAHDNGALDTWASVEFLAPIWSVATFIDLPEDTVRTRHPAGFMHIIRAFHALWALMSQGIPVVERANLPRQAKRGAYRDGITPNIVTIRLRRELNPSTDPGDGTNHYSTRFIVRGHWRHLRHEDGSVRKRVWVRPHEKGPEGAELVIKDRVFRWAR